MEEENKGEPEKPLQIPSSLVDLMFTSCGCTTKRTRESTQLLQKLLEIFLDGIDGSFLLLFL